MSKFAVIETGGKQYLVAEGESLKVERIKNIKKDGTVVFDKVLLSTDDDNIKIGAPYVKDAKVKASVEGEIRGKKVIILKYKPKTRYRIKRGHRQTYTKIKILEILNPKSCSLMH